MKALNLYGDYDVRYEDIEEPQVGPGLVKIKVHACGICGSDIPRFTASQCRYYPIVLGHEYAGEIVDVGEGVNTLKIGDHVSGAPLLPCMECIDCKNGNYSMCSNYSFTGSRVQGALAEYIVIPERNAILLDKNIPFEQGALIEPSSVAIHSIRRTDFCEGHDVAIIGGGMIGSFILQWVRILGASSVTVIGRNKDRLQMSSRLGADHIISTLDDDYEERIKEITGGRGFEYVFETGGNVDTLKLAFKIVSKMGKLCLPGMPATDITFTAAEWETIGRKQLKISGTWMSGSAPYPGDEWSLSAKYMSEGKLIYDQEIFSTKLKISEPDKLIEALRTKANTKGRILVLMQ